MAAAILPVPHAADAIPVIRPVVLLEGRLVAAEVEVGGILGGGRGFIC